MAQTREERLAYARAYNASAAGRAAKRRYQQSRKGERHRAAQAALREANYQRVADLKRATPCKDCGTHYPPVCMDYDHVDGPKVRAVSEMISNHASWEAISAEIEKCELVCANCHRLRTYPQR